MRTDDELLAEIESDADIDPERLITDPELVKIAAAQIRIKIAQRALDEAVTHARKNGRTWQAIGDTLGMTRQGALRRFAA
ncbi:MULTISPECIES: hypothetical protein [Actinotignum]|uniref:RNA polymerase subunit sigma-70 n=1 Tax=Actinotignum timonense TaxID=1870995 RepID=A0AAW9HE30_9ACTO|nr:MULTISPECIES: hypothetical protein [Actinotignum]MBS5748072.1 hypothetical protein [Actinotignum schaalii]MDE1536001.1 hypothetical protein [Actinotignum schaalii]MDE1558933.1 hypothetical protein [Actinotignum schaalii]MDE1663333.1 hypothetical protein [Actinotignum schaalii]MDK6373038.1 hypothetical protein [Actinotignum timonense]